MADIGIQPHIIEAVLNHISGHKAGVTGVYNRSTYANEKRAALDAWANHLRVIWRKPLPRRGVQRGTTNYGFSGLSTHWPYSQTSEPMRVPSGRRFPFKTQSANA